MSINAREVRQLINDHLPSSMFQMRVSSRQHYYLQIYAPAFWGWSHEEQKQMVRDALKKRDIGVNPDDIKIDPIEFKNDFLNFV